MLAFNAIVTQPVIIRTSATKSYCQVKVSPSQLVDKKIAMRICTPVVHEFSVRSTNYRQYISMPIAVIITIKPMKNRQVKYVFNDWSTSCSTRASVHSSALFALWALTSLREVLSKRSRFCWLSMCLWASFCRTNPIYKRVAPAIAPSSARMAVFILAKFKFKLLI